MTRFLVDGPDDAARTFVFAPGAGGSMASPFMATIARGIAEHGIRVVRFEFAYMALDEWRAVVRELGDGRRLVIGGKSFGGRMASLVADELDVTGLLCYGYPFHPPGKRDKLRTAHLENLRTPALIVQGTRDPFGSRDEVKAYKLSSTINVQWIEGGDHSLKGGLPRAIDLGVSFLTSI